MRYSKDNTERPVTVEVGTNILLGKISQSTYLDFKKVMTKIKKIRAPQNFGMVNHLTGYAKLLSNILN